MDKHSAPPTPVPPPSPVSAGEAKAIQSIEAGSLTHEVTFEESEDISRDETDFESEDTSRDETDFESEDTGCDETDFESEDTSYNETNETKSASPTPVPPPSPVSAGEAKVIQIIGARSLMHEVTSEENEDSSCDKMDFESEDASYDEKEEAIESGSDEEWEDVESEDVESEDVESGDNKPWENEVFQRIASEMNLIPRPSQLTTVMQESDRGSALQNTVSSFTSVVHQLPALNGSIDHSSRINQEYLQPFIMDPSNTDSQVLSSYRTRHHMVFREFSIALRRDLLWERLDKRTTFNAVNRRRHPHDIENLQSFPSEDENDYHQTGW